MRNILRRIIVGVAFFGAGTVAAAASPVAGLIAGTVVAVLVWLALGIVLPYQPSVIDKARFIDALDRPRQVQDKVRRYDQERSR